MVFLLGNQSKAQSTFHKRYGSDFYDIGHKVIQTLDGNYLIVGYTIGFGSGGNAMLIKVDTNGTILWVKDYAGINSDIIYDVEELSDISLVMVGSTGSYGAGNSDGFIMKTDVNGEYIWAKSYGDIGWEDFYQIEKDGNGGFYVLCGGYDFSSYNAVVIRFDGTGILQWARTNTNWTTANGESYGLAIKTVSSGGVILINTTGGPTAIDVFKFSDTGIQQWSSTYTPTPGGSGLNGLSIAEIQSGDLVINYAFANVNTVAQSLDNCILKLDASGNVIWNKSFGGTYSDYPNSILISNDNNIVLGGYSNSSGNGELDANIMKIDTSGSIIWSKNYGLVWSEYITDCIQGDNGEFVLTGQQWSEGYDYDSSKVYLLKTDAMGITSCNDITWSPVVSSQNVNISFGPNTQSYSISESQSIVWSANLRYLYTFDNCLPVNIHELTLSDHEWLLYPNPTMDQINLEMGMNNRDVEIEISDLFGRKVLVQPYQNVISLNYLESGCYLISLVSQGEVMSTKRLIKK